MVSGSRKMCLFFKTSAKKASYVMHHTVLIMLYVWTKALKKHSEPVPSVSNKLDPLHTNEPPGSVHVFLKALK